MIIWILNGMLGMKAGGVLFPKIDAYFDLDNGFHTPLKAWLIAGGIYMTLKVVKAGKHVVNKL